MVLESFIPDIEIPEVSFSKYIINYLEEKSEDDSIAYIEASSGLEFTHCDVLDKCKKFSSSLMKLGLKKQEIIAVCIGNNIYYPIIILGISACNAIMSPCNPNYTYSELVKQFRLCDPKYIITDEKQMKKMKRVQASVPSIKKVFTVKDVEKMINNDDGLDYPENMEVNPKEDVTMLPYSSGTTGLPKGVMLTHYNIIAIQAICRMGPVPEGSVHCHVLPLFHAYGLAYMFMTVGQMPFVIMDRFNVEQFCQCVEKYKITSLGGVPAVLAQLSKSDIPKKYDLSTLDVIGSGAAALSPDVCRNTMNKMDVHVVQGWGLTETTVITSNAIPGAPLDSVGAVVPNTKIKVVDPVTDKELGADEDGEILVKGPQVMKGYYRNEQQNRNAFDKDGWFRTGDIGHYNQDGYIYLVDRLKELIKYKGFQVPPAELEGIIVGHPLVTDCGVIGISDVNAGELPCAYVVRSNKSLTEHQLHQYVNEKVISYKRLRGGIYFINEIPRNPTGKILRRKLKEMSEKKKRRSKL